MKHILLILALLWALGASGQIYINSFTFGAAPAANLLLDDYPGAAAAYSLRKLRTAYTGNCVEVRRVSDGATSNIGFSGGVIDTATLKTFCAGTNCFVRTWYDQSGGGWDATQTNTAQQPQIIASGAVNKQDGLPAIFWDGTVRTLVSATLPAYADVLSTFSVNSFITPVQSTSVVFSMGSGGNNYVSLATSTTIRMAGGANLNDGTFVSGTNYLIYCLFNRTSSEINVNNVSTTGSSGTTFLTNGAIQIGYSTSVGNASRLRGNIQEIVIYRSNQSANQANIRVNINSFYNAY